MPAGAGTMMLISALVLSESSWRTAWLVAAAASLLVLLALFWKALPRRELDPAPAARRAILAEMIEVATSGGPLAIAFCFGAYACCWFAIVGFLPTLKSRSWAEIAASGSFCVNILGADQGELCWRFAKETEGRYDGLDWRKAPSGSPILPGVISWIDCSIEQLITMGDHWFVLGRVQALHNEGDVTDAMTFFRGKVCGVKVPS